MDRDMTRRSGAWAVPPGSRRCEGTGKSVKRAFDDISRCIVLTTHPSGLCGFCRRTEAS